MLQVVSEYSREPRFKLNRDKGKSEVVAFGIDEGEATTWTLGGGEISQVDTDKYLGIELGRKLDFTTFSTFLGLYAVCTAEWRRELIYANFRYMYHNLAK